MTLYRCKYERCLFAGIVLASIDVSPSIQQQQHHIAIASLSCVVKYGLEMVAGIDAKSLGKESIHHIGDIACDCPQQELRCLNS
ncbi:hypothetical protein N7537_002674 [Penicillium hordei]|uniref:Uncharacterized protein n=1 Tax=Penicillium hordei TaxID=40994 RepID=A0AAD6EJ60_9EURO|nr:uncharacterized protein N7537_002674 [Penicillium hordei]KAJ5617560.1 hypothetical protein N7537_002674 [Penicillium hordei]